MGMVEIKLSGLDQLQKALTEEQPKRAKSILRSALTAAGNIIRDAMVRNVPKDSGLLSENIGVKTSTRGSDELRGAAFIGPKGKAFYPARERGLGKKGRSRMPVVTIARVLEFGTSEMQARPFMTQSFEQEKGRALDKIISVIREKLGL